MRSRWSSLDTACALLVLALFALNVSRYAFLGDDGFICFRYAQNLIDGDGLVYNPGERVEGYTTFSWVMLMALVMRLGLAPEIAANAIGIACGASILALLVRFGRRRGMGAWAWVAPVALASNRTFTAWSTGGLETQMFALLVFAASLRFLAERAAERAGGPAAVRPFVSSLLFAGAVLTRPDGALFAAVAGSSFLLDAARGRRSARALVAWVLPFVAVVGAHEIWRLAYYGQPLPNTFYAKISGLWLAQSTVFLGLFVRDHYLWIFAPFLGVLAVRCARQRRDARADGVRCPSRSSERPLFLDARARKCEELDWHRTLFGMMLAAHLLYLLYVGGDRFEYRFLTPVLAPLYWLLAEALRVTTALVAARAGRALPALGAFLALALVASAAAPSFVPFEPAHGINSLENMEAMAEWRAEQGRFLRACADEGLLRGDELLGVRGAGALPYYSGFPALDLHGLNDLEIARLPVAERGIVAHEKIATEAILRERGVVICETKNDLLFDAPPPMLAQPIKRPYYEGPLRCVRLADKYLVFITTLDDAAFRAHFGHLEIVQ